MDGYAWREGGWRRGRRRRLWAVLVVWIPAVAGAQAPGDVRPPSEAVTSPDLWLEDARTAVVRLESLRRGPEVPDADRRAWTPLELAVARAADEAGSGDPCAAAETLAEVVRRVHRQGQSIDRDLEGSQAAPRSPHMTPAASDEERERLRGLGAERRGVEELLVAAVTAHRRFDGACRRLEATGTFQGLVADLDDPRRRVIFDDGGQVVLAAGLDPAAFDPGTALFPGAEIEGRWIRFDDGVTVATTLSPKTKVELVADALEKACLRLGFAPAQKAFGWDAGGVILHPVHGYVALGGKTYQVEVGTRVGALGIGCPKEDPAPGPKEITRRWLRVNLTYRPWGADKDKTILLASQLQTEFPKYIALPTNISSFHHAKLVEFSYTQDCSVSGTPLPPQCDPVQLAAIRDYTLVVRPWGSFCDAVYDTTLFDLEAAPQGFRPARVVDFLLEPAFVLEPEKVAFDAVGHRIQADGSAAQLPSVLGLDEPFAVSYNLGPPDPKPLESGADKESGLYWPQISGERNGGFPFRFSCQLPQITRDVLSFCPAGPPTLYKLPFDGPVPFRIMGQGNNGDFTHNGLTKYAFDFPLPEGEPVLAARGGVVIKVAESQMFNCKLFKPLNPKCFANAVEIRHEDGSVGIYYHFPFQGVTVDEGEEVERGDLLGWVGNTGMSTGPHIHFQTNEATAPMSIPIRFEAYQPSTTQILSCLVPRPGDALSSTNEF